MEHAVLIICHNNQSVVEAAIRIMDDKRFHFYIMIDKKSDINPDSLSKCCKLSSCEFVESRSIYWGGYSYTKAVIDLLKAALNNKNISYFHMLQGADLPLKTPNEIDDFFVKHFPTNYIEFCENNFSGMTYRMVCKHFFVENKFYRTNKWIHNLDSLIARIQYPFHKIQNFYCHSALFSITRDFCEYLINNESITSDQYKYSILAEESLFGTIIMNSPFKNTLDSTTETRYIDWKRRNGSSPHTFIIDDFNSLISCAKDDSHIFARKFSENVDIQIVLKLQDYLMERKPKTN